MPKRKKTVVEIAVTAFAEVWDSKINKYGEYKVKKHRNSKKNVKKQKKKRIGY